MIIKIRRNGAWRDPRLMLGGIFIVASIAAGSWIVHNTNGGAELYRTVHPLAAGMPVKTTDLEVIRSSREVAGDTYLPVGELQPDAVVVRNIGAGELLPSSAIGTDGTLETVPIVIDLAAALPTGTQIGSTIDLWFIPGNLTKNEETSELDSVAVDVAVSAIPEQNYNLAMQQHRVEVRVKKTELSTLLAAMGRDGKIIGVGATP